MNAIQAIFVVGGLCFVVNALVAVGFLFSAMSRNKTGPGIAFLTAVFVTEAVAFVAPFLGVSFFLTPLESMAAAFVVLVAGSVALSCLPLRGKPRRVRRRRPAAPAATAPAR